MNEAETNPPRPDHAAVAAALVRVAGGEPFLADVRPDETDHRLIVLDTVSQWRFAIWWRQGLGPLHSATDPDGLRWVYGCGRWPDWNAGPLAVVLDPIAHLLTAEHRSALRHRLLLAICWPPVEHAPIVAPSAAELWSDAELISMGGG